MRFNSLRLFAACFLILITASVSEGQVPATVGSKIEPMAILMYDTDIGFGYGVKAFLLNTLGRNESFDMTLFNSTGGERWYRLVFSIPDLAKRQGKVYPLSFDLYIDYDKFIKNRFFGVGNQTRFDDEERYTKEPFEVNLTFSRGFTPKTVGQVGVRYRTVRNFNFVKGDSSLFMDLPPLNRSRVTCNSLFANFRYDTRDSFVNPTNGLVLQGELEYASDIGSGNITFTRYATTFQYYILLLKPKTIFALRLMAQVLAGDDLPVQVLLPVGGVNTMRGMTQDRFLDRVSSLFNAEIRYPLFWKFGGVAGIDAGKVWNSPGEIDLSGWAANLVLGLRFYYETYVVRADFGFGRDAFGDRNTGFYFNFGHIF